MMKKKKSSELNFLRKVDNPTPVTFPCCCCCCCCSQCVMTHWSWDQPRKIDIFLIKDKASFNQFSRKGHCCLGVFSIPTLRLTEWVKILRLRVILKSGHFLAIAENMIHRPFYDHFLPETSKTPKLKIPKLWYQGIFDVYPPWYFLFQRWDPSCPARCGAEDFYSLLLPWSIWRHGTRYDKESAKDSIWVWQGCESESGQMIIWRHGKRYSCGVIDNLCQM